MWPAVLAGAWTIASGVEYVAEPVQDNGTQTIALIGMFGSLGVAMIATLGGVIQARISRSQPDGRWGRRHDPTAARVDALERFLLRHGFDPGKIENGDEPTEEARLASA